ncbi:MAG TPA: DUF2184 domain-containing protein [Acidimicrobiales bacterium]|nr:DUF2184 domain-containing protein [Acidimicrobiales bacterium]
MSRNAKLLYAATMAAAVVGTFQPRTVRAFTADGLMTYDAATRDAAGAFLVGELERLDQTLNMPLVEVTWSRDIQLREDVTIGDETASFTNTGFAAAGGPSAAGKNWAGKDANAIKGLAINIEKSSGPLTLWAMELAWSIPELESAQRVGRPIDSQKVEGMELKRQMDIDEQVYIGDEILGVTGLVNAAGVDLENVEGGDWANPATSPDEILADINKLLARAWKNTGYALCPTDLLLPPLKFAVLVSRKVSDAGNMSVLEYVRLNSLSNAKNGRPLNIKPLKWLEGRGAGNTDRMVAYTNDKKRVRFPMTPVQRTPLEHRSIYQMTTYLMRIGVVELVYPETVAYADGI